MLIEVDELSFAYRAGSSPVIAGLSHRFDPGTLTCLTGPSGSGKSTLLYVLALMLTPTAGAVRWAGSDVHSLRDGDRSQLRAAHAGFVFQDSVLDPSRTALDNVLEAAWYAGLPPQLAQRRALDLLAAFGLAERARHRPGEVSGGQAQRISLCRALVKRPGVIFADEPTGNLDAAASALVWDSLGAAAADGVTVIVATHDIARADSFEAHVRLAGPA